MTSKQPELKSEKLEFIFPRKQMLDAHGNSHWRARQGRVKKLRDIGREYGEDVKQGRDVFFDMFELIVTIKPPTRRHLDPPNFYPTIKPLVDGLTDAGWWKDDSFKYMLRTSFVYGGLSGVKKADGKSDLTAFRVILEIKEVTNPDLFITESEFFD